MQVNDLLIPQSWADMMIDEELDFSLDPRPYFDRELLDAPCHDDAYCISLAMTTMRYVYMPNSTEDASSEPSVAEYSITKDFLSQTTKTSAVAKIASNNSYP